LHLKMTGDSIFCNKFVKTFYVIECFQFYCYFSGSWHPKLSEKVYLSQENT
jgi:hypothetical protein